MDSAAYQRHLFICVNERPCDHPRGCCRERGAAEIHARMKARVKERGAKGLVRANKAGCLDFCEQGVTVVVYPDAVWYGAVTLEDADEIVDRHLLGGEVIERLRIDPEILSRGRGAPQSSAGKGKGDTRADAPDRPSSGSTS